MYRETPFTGMEEDLTSRQIHFPTRIDTYRIFYIFFMCGLKCNITCYWAGTWRPPPRAVLLLLITVGECCGASNTCRSAQPGWPALTSQMACRTDRTLCKNELRKATCACAACSPPTQKELLRLAVRIGGVPYWWLLPGLFSRVSSAPLSKCWHTISRP